MMIFLQIMNKEVKVKVDSDGTIGAIYVNEILADGRPGHENPEHAFAVKHSKEITVEATWQYDEAMRRNGWSW